MTPFYFGSGERRLFGIFTPGHKGAARDRGVVLCYPWGTEYLRAHRSMRQLAAQLARAGVDVLRFDYFGTGDSGGEMTAGDLAGWVEDIAAAIEELRETTRAERVGLAGLRLGATLAAAVAAERGAEIDNLVLWDPVVSGKEYVSELCREAASGLRTDPTDVAHIDGFPLTAAMRRQLLSLDLLALVPALPRRTLTIVSEALPSHAALGSALPIETVHAERAWYQERSFSVGAIPGNVLRRIVEWYG